MSKIAMYGELVAYYAHNYTPNTIDSSSQFAWVPPGINHPEVGYALNQPNGQITVNDHIFAKIIGTVPSSFLSDVVYLINQSPTLVADIQMADANKAAPQIVFSSGADNGGR